MPCFSFEKPEAYDKRLCGMWLCKAMAFHLSRSKCNWSNFRFSVLSAAEKRYCREATKMSHTATIPQINLGYPLSQVSEAWTFTPNMPHGPQPSMARLCMTYKIAAIPEAVANTLLKSYHLARSVSVHSLCFPGILYRGNSNCS